MAIEYIDIELAKWSVNEAIQELKDIYKESTPYTVVPLTTGKCYRWETDFINRMLYAFATDALAQFSQEELIAWWNFVNYQDHYSTSATTSDCNGLAIGATNYNSESKSYVVCSGMGITTILAQKPLDDMLSVDVWISLDKLFMNLLNCEPIENCTRTADLIDIAPCPLP